MNQPPSGRPRRHLLRAIAAGSVAGLAGCQDGATSPSNDDTGDPGDSTDGSGGSSDEPADDGTDEATDGESTNADGETDHQSDGADETDETGDDDGNDAGDETGSDSDGGDEPAKSPADHLQLMVASGAVRDDVIDEVSFIVALGAGMESIDLSSFTIEYMDTETSASLKHGGEGSEATSASTFGTAIVYGAESHSKLTESDDRIEVIVDVAAIDGIDGLTPGSQCQFAFVDETGAEYVYEAQAPSEFGDKDSVQI